MAHWKLNDSHHKDEDERAVFVDTSLNTHLVVHTSPSFSFSSLKERIVMEHSKCFPDIGEIKITALKVSRAGKYYHVSESMLVKTAFRGVECWFVFVDVVDWPMIMCNAVDKLLETRDSELGGSTQRIRKKNKSNNKHTETLVESSSFQELPSSEKNHWFESSAPRIGASLLESKSLLPGFNGKLHESANLIEKSGGEMTRVDKRYGDCDTDDHVHDKEVVDPLKSANLNDSSELGKSATKQKKEKSKSSTTGTDISSGKTHNLESVVNTTGDASGSQAKKTKNKGVDGVNISHAAEIHRVPDSMTSGITAPDKWDVKENGNGTLGSSYMKETVETENTVKKRKRSSSEIFTEMHHVPDILSSGVAAPDKWDVKENDNGTLGSHYMKENVETENTVKKRKRSSCKTSVIEKEVQSLTSQNQSQELSDLRQGGEELLQAAEIGKPKQDLDKMTNRKMRYQTKPSISALGTSEISFKDQLSEKMKEFVAPATVERVCVRNKCGTDDKSLSHPEESSECPVSQVFEDLAEGTKQDKPKSTKQKMKKSKDKERTFHLDSQGKNDGVEVNRMKQIDDDLVQPAINSNLGEKVAVKSGKAMKRSKERLTASATDVPEIPVIDEMDDRKSEMGAAKTPDGDRVIDSGVNGNDTEQQSGLGDHHDGLFNNVPVQQVSADVTDVSNLDKPQTNQTRLIDAGSLQQTQANELEMEISSDKARKKAQKIQPASAKALTELPRELLSVTKSKETGGALLPPNNDSEFDSKHQREVSLLNQHLGGLADDRNLEKQKARKSKHKKHDLPSPVDALSNEHKAVASKKTDKVQRNVDTLSEPQNDVQKEVHSSQMGSQSLQLHQVSQQAEHINGFSDIAKKKMRKKPTASLSEFQIEQQLDEEKKTDMPKGVEEANGDLTNGDTNSVQHRNRESESKGHHDEFGDIPSREVLWDPAEAKKSVKPRASKQKVKNAGQSSSLDTASKGENLTVSGKDGNTSLNLNQRQQPITGSTYTIMPCSIATKPTTSKEARDISSPSGHDFNLLADTRVDNSHFSKSGVQNPNCDDGSRASATSSLRSGSSSKKTELRSKRKEHGVLKMPSKKILGKAANPLPQKKSSPATPSGALFGDLSESSDDDENKGSSSSTQTLSEEFSSDYSVGESKGYVVSSQHDILGSDSGGKDKTDANVSPLKNMDLKAILKSSSRFKKAKLMASQSMEDTESQPPEVVPDSQA